MIVGNLNERKKVNSTTGSPPKTNIQFYPFVTEQITLRNDVGKAQKPTSSSKFSKIYFSETDDDGHSDVKSKQATSIWKSQKTGFANTPSKRKFFCHTENKIVSDPPNVFYTEYKSSLQNSSAAVWQQQMTNTPTQLTDVDHASHRLPYKTHTTRSLPS